MAEGLSEQDRFNAWCLRWVGCPDAVIAYVFGMEPLALQEELQRGLPNLPKPQRVMPPEVVEAVKNGLLAKGINPITIFTILGIQ